MQADVQLMQKDWNHIDCIKQGALVSAAAVEKSPIAMINVLLVRFQIEMHNTHINSLVEAEGCMRCPYTQTVTT